MGEFGAWPTVAAVMIFAIPIVAIAGGITAGIFKTRGQQRIIELAQRERIAAIEKGIDPTKLPPLPAVGSDASQEALRMLAMQLPPTPRQAELRRAQGFTIGGLVLLSIGVGLSAMLLLLSEPDANKAWSVGLILDFMGAALLWSGHIVRRDAPEESVGSDRPRT